MQGRRAKLEAGARNVHGEIADEIVKAELAALAKQRKANDSWHVVGLDSKLDASVMAADEHTAIRQLKRDAGAHLTGAHEEAEDDEEIRRLQEEIAMLDRMNAVMYEQPEIPVHERPRSPARVHPHMYPARASDTEQLHRGGPAGNRSTDAGPGRIDAHGGGALLHQTCPPRQFRAVFSALRGFHTEITSRRRKRSRGQNRMPSRGAIRRSSMSRFECARTHMMRVSVLAHT